MNRTDIQNKIDQAEKDKAAIEKNIQELKDQLIPKIDIGDRIVFTASGNQYICCYVHGYYCMIKYYSGNSTSIGKTLYCDQFRFLSDLNDKMARNDRDWYII